MNQPPDRFYVGYLPLPKPVRKAVLITVPLLLLTVIATAAILAATQDHPGPAVWTQLDTSSETPTTVTLTGVYLDQPYPAIWTEDEKLHLLVQQGKSNATSIAAAANIQAGDFVSATCFTLSREGQFMYELIDEDALVHILAIPFPGADAISQSSVMDSARQLQSMQVVGEVIDPKCYLGAMKPGDGVTHRACAILCLKGGIPPMLVDRSGSEPVYYLLTDGEGNGIGRETNTSAFPIDALFPYVGVQTSITGQSFVFGGQHVLAVDQPASITTATVSNTAME